MATTALETSGTARVAVIRMPSDNPKSPVKITLAVDGTPRRVQSNGVWELQDGTQWVTVSFFPSQPGFETTIARINDGSLVKGAYVNVSGRADSEAYKAKDGSMRHNLILRDATLTLVDN